MSFRVLPGRGTHALRNTTEPAPEADEITYENLRRRLRDPDLVIVNVLPRVSFEEARISGSISVPLAQIRSGARADLPDPSREIAVYCGGPT